MNFKMYSSVKPGFVHTGMFRFFLSLLSILTGQNSRKTIMSSSSAFSLIRVVKWCITEIIMLRSDWLIDGFDKLGWILYLVVLVTPWMATAWRAQWFRDPKARNSVWSDCCEHFSLEGHRAQSKNIGMFWSRFFTPDPVILSICKYCAWSNIYFLLYFC